MSGMEMIFIYLLYHIMIKPKKY